MAQHASTASALADFQRVPQFIEENRGVVSEGRVRWWLRDRDENGLIESGAVVEINGHLYINVPRFVAWFQAGGKAPSEAA